MFAGFFWYHLLPAQQHVRVGDTIDTGQGIPDLIARNLSLHLRSQSAVFSVDGNSCKELTCNLGAKKPVALQPGKLEMQVKLFGFLPVHRVMLQVVAPEKVIPGGQSIGVLLHAEGVMVVGEAPVKKNGRYVYPARQAGISAGDVILQANGRQVAGEVQLQKIIDDCGKQGKHIILLVKHGKKTIRAKIKPEYCEEAGRFRIGLFVKDSTAGVGTLTFYEPRTRTYGALGHIILDINGSGKINLTEGKIVEASIKGLHPGKKGEPGEKMGVFKGRGDIIGNIEKNTECGIFGTLNAILTNPFFRAPIPVAMRYQVKEGPATMYTVLESNRIEEFHIEIERVLPENKRGKGLVIKVKDPELIARTGGIIQGMSGSPIVQNGRLVGAVTHVFVNDPTKGYGVFAENMLIEANLLNYKKMQSKAG